VRADSVSSPNRDAFERSVESLDGWLVLLHQVDKSEQEISHYLQQDQLSELVVDREHEVRSVHRHVVEARQSVPLKVLPAKVLAGLVIRQDRHRHSQVSSDHLHQSHAQENARVSHLLLTDEHSEGD